MATGAIVLIVIRWTKPKPLRLNGTILKLINPEKHDMEKTVNYTAEQTTALVEAYKANPSEDTVKAFAEQFGKSVRSIVAKLSRENVYIKKEYKAKDGSNPLAKDELATLIGEFVGLSEGEMESLAKANKTALQKILVKIQG